MKYVLSFDDSLNKVHQLEQMDMIIHLWDNQKNKICSRYFESIFLGHTTASDLLQSLKSSVTAQNLAGLIQLSEDGPHTNWKLFEELTEDSNISDQELPRLINTGSCGLHIVHGAFKTGAVATGLHIDNLIKSLLFSDSPAKREDYMKASTMKKLPLQFCYFQMVRGYSCC